MVFLCSASTDQNWSQIQLKAVPWAQPSSICNPRHWPLHQTRALHLLDHSWYKWHLSKYVKFLSLSLRHQTIDSKTKILFRNYQNTYMPTLNRSEYLILKRFCKGQTYTKPTLSLHWAYTKLGKNDKSYDDYVVEMSQILSGHIPDDRNLPVSKVMRSTHVRVRNLRGAWKILSRISHEALTFLYAQRLQSRTLHSPNRDTQATWKLNYGWFHVGSV